MGGGGMGGGGMPRAKGVGRRHKKGTGNEKHKPAKRQIGQGNGGGSSSSVATRQAVLRDSPLREGSRQRAQPTMYNKDGKWIGGARRMDMEGLEPEKVKELEGIRERGKKHRAKKKAAAAPVAAAAAPAAATNPGDIYEAKGRKRDALTKATERAESSLPFSPQ